LSGGIPRLCNQGILNYLLIVLRKDKDFVKFWNVVKLLTDQPELRKAVERIQKGTVCICSTMYVYLNNVFVCLYYTCVCLHVHISVCACV